MKFSLSAYFSVLFAACSQSLSMFVCVIRLLPGASPPLFNCSSFLVYAGEYAIILRVRFYLSSSASSATTRFSADNSVTLTSNRRTSPLRIRFYHGSYHVPGGYQPSRRSSPGRSEPLWRRLSGESRSSKRFLPLRSW